MSLKDSKWQANIHGVEKMKQEETKKVEVYYERIQNLAHDLQVPTTDNFLIIMFRAGL
jgi:hypothetical protein